MAGALKGVRVLELAGEVSEYCGKLLAGMGADVLLVEPPEGSPTRMTGPSTTTSETPTAASTSGTTTSTRRASPVT